MSSMFKYTLPVEQTRWAFEGQNETVFSWEYDDVRAELLKLYDKGKTQQWDAAERIDWSTDLDPENPMEMDDRTIPIYGSGKQVRDWLYVKDHCAAIEHVAGLKRWGEVFNIAGRCEKTNLEIVGELLSLTGSKAGFEHVGDRLGHDFRYSLDDAKLRATGWRSAVAWGDGLRHLV